MHNRRWRQGFSLLELMIVLIIMAAATAVVWPNLQRPLRRTSLSESASLVRELLDDARNTAITRGSACFVRFQTGSGRLHWGTLQQFLDDNSLSGNSLFSTSVASTSRPQQQLSGFDRPSTGSAIMESSTADVQPPHQRDLPESVVVYDVRFDIGPERSSSSELGAFDRSSPDVLSENYSSKFEKVDRPSIPTQSLKTELASTVSWLPMLANDLGRDARITLYDTQLHESIEIDFCAATGAIQILP